MVPIILTASMVNDFRTIKDKWKNSVELWIWPGHLYQVNPQFFYHSTYEGSGRETIHIGIRRHHSAPKGSGKRALQDLCALADKLHVPLSLNVSGGHSKLIRLYRSLGFKRIDKQFSPIMVRSPCPSQASQKTVLK